MKWLMGWLLLAGGMAHAGELRLQIEGCLPGKPVRVALYDSARAFGRDRDGQTALRRVEVLAEHRSVSLVLAGLAAGSYALSVFADANGNQQLDTNFVGNPIEPYGFSRDARALFGPPDFEQARFEIGADAVTETIHLK